MVFWWCAVQRGFWLGWPRLCNSTAPYTGETTRGLPQPQYGELRNFGYAPKPGHSVVEHNWQRYVPTSVLLHYIPRAVLAEYLDASTLAMLEPHASGSGRPARLLVGWQLAIPAKVVAQHVPLHVLEEYVPPGIELAAPSGSNTRANESLNSTSASELPATAKPAPRRSGPGPLRPRSELAAAAVLQPAPVHMGSDSWVHPSVGAAKQLPVGAELALSGNRHMDSGDAPVAEVDGAAAYMSFGALAPAEAALNFDHDPGLNRAPSTAAALKPNNAGHGGAGLVWVGEPHSLGAVPLALGAAARVLKPVVAALLAPELQAGLDRHNILRAIHQRQPLTWDVTLAGTAQTWAATCPNGHSGEPGVGENMACEAVRCCWLRYVMGRGKVFGRTRGPEGPGVAAGIQFTQLFGLFSCTQLPKTLHLPPPCLPSPLVSSDAPNAAHSCLLGRPHHQGGTAP